MVITAPPKITIEAARINAGFTLKEAAKLIGVSVSTLHKWEQDSSDLKISQSLKLSAVYGYPVEYIFFGNKLEFNSTN